MGRYKFYTINDRGMNFPYDRINELLESIELDEDILLIDVLEYYNIYRLVENIKENDSNHKLVDEHKQKNIKSFIAKYFNTKNKSDIIQDFNAFNKNVKEDFENKERLIQYFDDYLICFEKYKLHSKIEEVDFEKILELESIPIRYYLVSSYFSKIYPEQIKKNILSKPSNFKLVISGFINGGEKYNFPSIISSKEYSQLCKDYINSEGVNPNYLQILFKGVSGINGYFDLTPNIQLRAKKRYQEIMNELMKSENTIHYKNSFTIFKNYEEYISCDSIYKALMDVDWLINNSDSYSLLSYFRAVNYFFIDEFYLGLCSYPNFEMDIFEKIFGVRTKRHYEVGSHFNNKNFLLKNFIHAYQNFLSNNLDSSLELVLQYYFNDYIFDKYGINFLKVEFPIEQMSIKNKTLCLLVLEENLRKQWNLFVEEGEVTADLFAFCSKTPSFQELGSLVEKKHFYINEEDQTQQKIMLLLFSDQAFINYVSKEKRADNFVDLIVKNNVKLDEYKENAEDVEFLIVNNVVTDDGDHLYFNVAQGIKVFEYMCIYNYGSISRLSLSSESDGPFNETRNLVIDEMVNEQILYARSTLYSKSEADYLSFIINDSLFDNSLGIRNKYGHGSVVEDDYDDYYYSLLVLVMFALKIDQELIYINNNK
ncbi:hypothetical protein [Erysipelothrix rhusiopathiae]|uniref:hypothetical protein n=1 Tax=Erysipelothrix rhusiopathiae TaxID=1648 RepID=UPI0039E8EA7B